MDRVEEMRIAGTSCSVKFMEFTRACSKNPEMLVCIFEGEDEKYYSPRLNMYIERHLWHGINAGGRSKVLELLHCIVDHPEYKESHFACFIDRDYEHWFINDLPTRLYVTPCYSVENLYTSENCFKSILSAEFDISEHQDCRDDFDFCISTGRLIFSQFNNAIAQFNIWAKAHRIMERDGKISRKLNIQNVKTHNLVKISLDGVELQYDPSNPDSVFPDCTPVSIDADAEQEAMRTLPSEHWQNDFRGKQQLDCMRLLLVHLKSDRCSDTPKNFTRKSNVGLSLSRDNCISDLSQYADTPECLKIFLENLSLLKKQNSIPSPAMQ